MSVTEVNSKFVLRTAFSWLETLRCVSMDSLDKSNF